MPAIDNRMGVAAAAIFGAASGTHLPATAVPRNCPVKKQEPTGITRRGHHRVVALKRSKPSEALSPGEHDHETSTGASQYFRSSRDSAEARGHHGTAV